MNYLSLVTVVAQEAPYIAEWCRYHYALGIDHIYLYDNGTDGTGVIAKREGKDKITVSYVQGVAVQLPTFTQALAVHGPHNRWLGFMDTDEYIVPKDGRNIKAILQDYENYPGVCFHWRLFGSNGHEKYEDKPVVERFTRCAAATNPHVKSFVDPKKTLRIVTAHKWVHLGNAVDENKKEIPSLESCPTPATSNIVQINHYVVKSKEECWERRSRPRSDTGGLHVLPEFFTAHDVNEVEDLSALNLWKSI